jgi:hypothetical protein
MHINTCKQILRTNRCIKPCKGLEQSNLQYDLYLLQMIILCLNRAILRRHKHSYVSGLIAIKWIGLHNLKIPNATTLWDLKSVDVFINTLHSNCWILLGPVILSQVTFMWGPRRLCKKHHWQKLFSVTLNSTQS